MSCPEKFLPDEDEQLIELVHANSCLWNMADPEFKKEKRFIWAEIGRKLTRRPRSGVECKSRWRSIRDYYKKQKKDEKNGVPAIKRRQVYWNSLKFLDEVDDELKALSNVHVEISENTENMDIIDYQDSGSDLSETLLANLHSKRRKIYKEEVRVGYDVVDERKEQSENVSEDGYCKQTEETVDCGSDKLEHRLKQLSEHRTAQDPDIKSAVSENRIDDEIDLFFKAMAATVKKFPPKLKAVSKARIFTVVNELEMRHLELTSQFPNFMSDQGE